MIRYFVKTNLGYTHIESDLTFNNHIKKKEVERKLAEKEGYKTIKIKRVEND